jgi:protein-S-isoprenylcysteine O-methyltransferase Ste14
MRPGSALLALWATFIISWVIAAAWSSRTERRPSPLIEAGFRIPLLIGAALLCVSARRHVAASLAWRIGARRAWACVALAAIGIAFTWCARIYLGKLWSAAIGRKVDHRLVDSGPYSIVRHPIYTGLLLALAATAAAEATLLALGGFLLVALGLWMKASAEERWLSQELDAGSYAHYRARVPMLIPFLPRKALGNEKGGNDSGTNERP